MVSIIVPVYNAERFLQEALDSILAQEGVEIEVVAVDDGSTDSSAAILARCAERDSRVSVVATDNRGVSAARNAGIDAARGEWIAFVDADDAMLPGALARLVKVATDSGCDIAMGAFVTDKARIPAADKGEARVIASRDIVLSTLYQRGAVNRRCSLNSVWGKLFSRRLFTPDRRFAASLRYEDLDLCYRLYMAVDKVAVTMAPVYFYRVHPDSFMQQYTPRRLDALTVTDRMVDILADADPALLRGAHDRRFSAYYNMCLLALKHGKPEVATRCLEVITMMRRRVLLNPHARLKNRLGAMLAYFPSLLPRFAR